MFAFKFHTLYLSTSLVFIASCSTHVENLASENYEPIIPQAIKSEQHLKPSGAI
jgi:hypothetical protein